MCRAKQGDRLPRGGALSSAAPGFVGDESCKTGILIIIIMTLLARTYELPHEGAGRNEGDSDFSKL